MHYDQTRPRPRGAGVRRLIGALGILCLLLGAAPALGEGSPDGVVNVNTATPAELALLPGIGEAKARAIVAARTERGGFESVDELVEVKGIGDTALQRIRPFVTVAGKTTLRE